MTKIVSYLSSTLTLAMLVVSACDGQAAEARRECDLLKGQLGLTGAAYDRCLADEMHRAALRSELNEDQARLLAQEHNRDREVITPGLPPELFRRVLSLGDVPQVASDEGNKYIGEMLVVDARLSYFWDDADGSAHLTLETVEPDQEVFVIPDVDALSARQLEFLNRYCWLNLGQRSSACEGDVYLSVAPDPAVPGWASLQIVGARFRPADPEIVLKAMPQ